MLSSYKKAILYLFCNVARLIKIQFDELVSFHSISYLSVVSIVHAFQVRVLFP